jgi:hypothetical protein
MTATGGLLPGPADAVLAHISGGADIVVPLANGEPPRLLDTLEAHHDQLSGVRVHQVHALAERADIRGSSESGSAMSATSYLQRLAPPTGPAAATWCPTISLKSRRG